MPDGTLFEVLAAANYMEIQPLLDLACLRITFSLQGKNAEEVRLLVVSLHLACTHRYSVIRHIRSCK